MLITRGQSKQGTVLVLGLSRANVEALMDDRPAIIISKENHGEVLPEGLEIIIFFGETEEEMKKMFKDMIYSS